LKKHWKKLAVTLVLTGTLLSGCGVSSKAVEREKLQQFPVFPELSQAFYELAPREDLDRLLKREWDLTAWRRQAEERLK
jgi:hypothetical protein